MMQTEIEHRGAILQPGLILGAGFGGFVDGILLHQILQWHHMLTSAGYPPLTVGNLQVNTLADGLFHAVTWLLTLAGVGMLWRNMRRTSRPQPGKVLIGAMLMGWGLFNLVEGLINHHLLGIHHVRSGPNELGYDLGFLIFGALLLAGGWLLVQAGRQQTMPPRVAPPQSRS